MQQNSCIVARVSVTYLCTCLQLSCSDRFFLHNARPFPSRCSHSLLSFIPLPCTPFRPSSPSQFVFYCSLLFPLFNLLPFFHFPSPSASPPFLSSRPFYSTPTHSLPCPVFCFLPFPFPLPCSPFFSTDPPLPLSVSSPPLPSRFLPFLPRGGLSMACCRFCSSSALPAVSSYSAMLCWSGTSYSSMSVCVCVCLSVVVVLSKRVNKSRWF